MHETIDRVIERAVAEALRDAERRGWLREPPHNLARAIVRAVCDELHPLGRIAVPSAAHIDAAQNLRDRDRRIRETFDGHNHLALAMRFQLSTRQIRRIVERK